MTKTLLVSTLFASLLAGSALAQANYIFSPRGVEL